MAANESKVLSVKLKTQSFCMSLRSYYGGEVLNLNKKLEKSAGALKVEALQGL